MKNQFYLFAFLCLTAILNMSCNSDDEFSDTQPTVEIGSNDQTVEISFTTLKISGNVSSNGGNEIISRGICWSTNPNPTISDFKNEEASNNFTSLLENLTANTTYYLRVFATTSIGTVYSNEQTFSTSSLDDTTWDFYLMHDTNLTWHADVTFNADGTTVYDEPDFPGMYTTYGTWTLEGNTLTYIMDPEMSVYHFTGTITENTMAGTYTFGPDRNWSATKY